MRVDLIFYSKWRSKPYLRYEEELGNYLMIVNQKRDMRRIGVLMKTANKVVKIERKKNAIFSIATYKEGER